MRFVQQLLAKRHILYALGLIAGGGLLLANSLTSAMVSAQSANSVYVTPASGTYDVGATIVVSVRVNTDVLVNTVQADMTYSANLQFVSIDATGSAFSIDASSGGGSGSVTTARGTTSAVSGDQLVAKINFKALSAGTGTVTMLGSSRALSNADSSDVLTTRNGGSFTLKTPAGVTPTPTPTPPVTPPATTGSSAGGTTKTSNNKPAVTVTPQGGTQATPLPGDSKVELQAPIDIQTTTDGTKDVTKVEYLVNGKVVATDTSAPYTHALDIKNMRNGTYQLTTKTYYKDGKVDTSNSSFVVSNPFGWTQLRLQVRHYIWLVIILVVVAGELVYLKFFRHRTSGVHKGPSSGASGGTYGTAGHGSVVVGGTGGTISPSAMVTEPAYSDQNNNLHSS